MRIIDEHMKLNGLGPRLTAAYRVHVAVLTKVLWTVVHDTTPYYISHYSLGSEKARAVSTDL